VVPRQPLPQEMDSESEPGGVEPEEKPTSDAIGTLGEHPGDTTCSLQAARSWRSDANVVGYRSFEAAAEDVIQRRLRGFVVPCAYPDLGHFIMDARLTTAEAFLHVLPPLVLVSTLEILPKFLAVLYCHPAVVPLLPGLTLEYRELRLVDSNPHAVTQLLDDPDRERAAAVTNGLSADRHPVQVHEVLRRNLVMPFLYMVKV